MSSDPRCDRSDLPVAMCAHCRGHDEPVALAAGEMGVPFLAEYGGSCGTCSERIRPGELIARLATGGYACDDCVSS